jgi:hypothetical protein
MPDRPGTDAAGRGRHENRIEGLMRAELQMQVGALTRQAVMLLYGIGKETLRAWEQQGLKWFHKGNRRFYRRVEVERFFSLDEPPPKQQKASKK